METRRDALLAIPVAYDQGGFEADDLRRKLLPLLTKEIGFVYGSGFENQPDLLYEIEQRCRVFGNTAETVRMVKDPGYFFSLLSGMDIPFPEIALDVPEHSEGWLGKRIGGSGGTHVQPLPADSPFDYYQKRVPGRPCSLLFLANGRGDIRTVGFNEQWLAEVPGKPYLYGGAVSQANLSEPVRAAMLSAAQRISARFGLRGLNSLDCMVDGGRMWVLEINPRLSASFALYDVANEGARLFQSHLLACVGELGAEFPAESACAHLIYYAPFDLSVPAATHWPDWATDIPVGPVQAKAGDPLCTVTASAADAGSARKLVEKRAAELLGRIN